MHILRRNDGKYLRVAPPRSRPTVTWVDKNSATRWKWPKHAFRYVTKEERELVTLETVE